MTDEKLLNATRIEGCTLVGYMISEYPAKKGNCFSVSTDCGGYYKIVNFSYENMVEAINRGISYPIKIRQIGDKTAIVHDCRIPDDWYDARWCEVCCPESLLPVTQMLEHERQVSSGVRVNRGDAILINLGGAPKLPAKESKSGGTT